MPGDTVQWHRPDYRGREAELISHADAAALAGVTRSAVSNWAQRHSGFPTAVLTAGPRVFVVAAEFHTWLAQHRSESRKSRKATAVAVTGANASIRRLEAKAGRQREALAVTETALATARALLIELTQ